MASASWKSEDRLLGLIIRTLVGEIGQFAWALPVEPKLETAEQHERDDRLARGLVMAILRREVQLL